MRYRIETLSGREINGGNRLQETLNKASVICRDNATFVRIRRVAPKPGGFSLCVLDPEAYCIGWFKYPRLTSRGTSATVGHHEQSMPLCTRTT